jgi:hypothetical protein
LGIKEGSVQPDLSLIAEHAGEINVDPVTSDDRLTQLQEQVEYLLEEVGQENKFRTELSDYISDLRAEAKFIKIARIVFGGVATVVGVGLLITPVVLAFSESKVFIALPAYPKSALLIGMIAGGVLLIQAVTKSVYRSAQERQNDEFIPPQLKLIHDMTKGGGGAGS